MVELAGEHDPGFIAVLWSTGVLKVVGGLLGLALVSRWYTYLWGPWFLAGGLAFIFAARTHLSEVADRGMSRSPA